MRGCREKRFGIYLSFKSLNSTRRLDMMERLANAMRGEHLAALRSHDDLLAAIPELNGWEVWAGDGHAMAHATHDARNARDAHRSVHGIHRLDIRSGWCDFTALVPPTDNGHEHEIKIPSVQAASATPDAGSHVPPASEPAGKHPAQPGEIVGLIANTRAAIRVRGYSPRTEETYLQWINRYLEFHHRQHPAKLGPTSITPFLSPIS